MLCSVAEYRTFTADLVTANTTCTALIEIATGMVEDHLSRLLEEDEVTESLQLWPGFYVYPTLLPVTVVESGNVIDPILRFKFYVQSPVYDLSNPLRCDIVTVTYTGGYTATTCPGIIKRAIAMVARAVGQATPNAPSGGPATVGDITAPYSAGDVGSPLDRLVPGISATLANYQRPAIA